MRCTVRKQIDRGVSLHGSLKVNFCLTHISQKGGDVLVALFGLKINVSQNHVIFIENNLKVFAKFEL